MAILKINMQFPSQFYSISDDSLLDLSLWLRSSCWEPHLGDVISTYFNDNKLTKMALSLDLRKKNMGMSENPPIIAIIAMDNDH